MSATTVLLLVALVSSGITFDYLFLAPRRWLKRHGSGNYHRDRRPLDFFIRQYTNNQLLESYGENPKGRDTSP
jgi:hypothetical protein